MAGSSCGFEQAFGVVPGIALAAVCFEAYDVGTFPPSRVASLVAFGTFFGGLFRAAGGNLLVLWHLTWAVTSSIGVLEAASASDGPTSRRTRYYWSSKPR